MHSPGIDALGFEFTNAQLTPALGAAKHPKVRTPMTPELGQFHFQPKSSHFDTGGYFRLIVKTALIFPILRQARKGATVTADSGATVWLSGLPP